MTRVEKIGNATLYLGDCREVLPTLPKHDLALTDPPYGINVGAMNMGAGKKATTFESFDWDSDPPPDWLFGLLREKARDLIVWGGNYFSLEPNGCWLSWDKMQEFSGADFELAYTTLSGPSKTFRMSRVQAYGAVERDHPTQKPLPLFLWCLGRVPAAATVLDPFMGSGTTGVACAHADKAFTGIEREPKYFEIACERIYNAYRQNTLFGQDENVQEVPASQTAIEFQQE